MFTRLCIEFAITSAIVYGVFASKSSKRKNSSTSLWGTKCMAVIALAVCLFLASIPKPALSFYDILNVSPKSKHSDNVEYLLGVKIAASRQLKNDPEALHQLNSMVDILMKPSTASLYHRFGDKFIDETVSQAWADSVLFQSIGLALVDAVFIFVLATVCTFATAFRPARTFIGIWCLIVFTFEVQERISGDVLDSQHSGGVFSSLGIYLPFEKCQFLKRISSSVFCILIGFAGATFEDNENAIKSELRALIGLQFLLSRSIQSLTTRQQQQHAAHPIQLKPSTTMPTTEEETAPVKGKED